LLLVDRLPSFRSQWGAGALAGADPRENRDVPISDDTYAWRRDLPHLQKNGKTYFVTFGTHDREVLLYSHRDITLATCIRGHLDQFWLHTAVVMPDHVHVIFTPYDAHGLKQIMQT